jgi:hypothetical protein
MVRKYQPFTREKKGVLEMDQYELIVPDRENP